MAEVVDLYGNRRSPEPEPNLTVVEELERLLEAARSGELVGFCGAAMNKDRVVSYSYAGLVAGYTMIGGLACLKERLMQIVMGRD